MQSIMFLHLLSHTFILKSFLNIGYDNQKTFEFQVLFLKYLDVLTN